jgi:hypothetical protein
MRFSNPLPLRSAGRIDRPRRPGLTGAGVCMHAAGVFGSAGSFGGLTGNARQRHAALSLALPSSHQQPLGAPRSRLCCSCCWAVRLVKVKASSQLQCVRDRSSTLLSTCSQVNVNVVLFYLSGWMWMSIERLLPRSLYKHSSISMMHV